MFDPYHKWLGIPQNRRPPTYYDLLGIDLAEQDVEVIDGAALRQIAHVRTYQSGPHAADCARILGELALARRTLTSPDRRAQYDAKIAPAPEPGPSGSGFAPAVAAPMVVTEVEPIRERGGGAASRWLAPILTTSVLTIGIALAAFQGWIPGVRLGHRPAPIAEAPEAPAAVETPAVADARPPRVAEDRTPAPEPPPAGTQVPVPAMPTGPLPREAVVAALAPRPDDTLPDLPELVDPDAAFLDVTFEPPDAQPRLICDLASSHVLNGPGRVVESYAKVTKAGGQVALGMTRPGYLTIQDRPVNLMPGHRVVVQVRMAPAGSPAAELVHVAGTPPLVGPAKRAVAANPPANPPAAAPNGNPGAFDKPTGRAIEGGYAARLGVLPVNDLAVTADGKHAIISHGDVRSFNLETGRPESSSNGQIQNATAVAVPPSGHGFVATGSADGYAAIWSTAGRNWARSRPRPVEDKSKTPVKRVEYSRDGKLLAAVIDNRVSLIKPEGSNLVVASYPLLGNFRAMAFGPDTFWIASESKVDAYDVSNRAAPKPIDRPALLAALAEGPTIHGLAVHPDGKRLFVARKGGILQEWYLEAEGPPRTIAEDRFAEIAGISLAADGSRIASYGDTRIRVYNMETGQVDARLIGHTATVVAAQFLPDDPRVIVSLGREPSLRVWDLDEGGARQRPWNPADPDDLVKTPARVGTP